MALEVVDVLQRVDGTARAADLIALCGRAALVRAVRSGRVVRVARGRYALATCPDPWVSALRLAGVVSHRSAAQHWGLAVLNRPQVPDVTIGPNRHDVVTGAARLHWASLDGADVDRDLSVTTPLRTVLDCAGSLPFGSGLAVADSALRLKLVGPAELQRAADRRRGPGRGRIRRVAGAADARAGSGLESALRAIFIGGRITGFVPQVVVRDGDFFARVDLGDPVRKILAEADSFEHHGSRAALARDCRRYDELVARGWRVLRYAWEHVMFDEAWVTDIARTTIDQPRSRLVTRRPGGVSRYRRAS